MAPSNHERYNQNVACDVQIPCLLTELSWTAPELLNSVDKEGRVTQSSQEGDIYAAAIILKEIFARNGPYTELDYMSPEGRYTLI